MEFAELKNALQQHVADMLQDTRQLYVTGVNKDTLWEIYLNSFPQGANETFRERRFYDCSCCRSFIRAFGNVVAIRDNKVVSIWDFETGDETFQPVINALSAFVKTAPVNYCFVTKEGAFGTDFNHEQRDDGTVHTWHHFRVDLPSTFVTKSSKSVAALMGELRDARNVFQRSLEEISPDALGTVVDLIAEKTLYKGDEWAGVLARFSELQAEYRALPDDEKDNYCWSTQVSGAVSRIRNHSIGTLLKDVTEGVDVETAVRKYEAIVAPQNYKRPKPIFTNRMVEQAQQTIEELGLLDSLGRRHATLGDITINNVIFADRDAAKQMNGGVGVFEALKQEASVNPKQFERVPGVGIDQFITDILPNATSLSVLLLNQHAPNLVSLIAPEVKESPTLFKWDNGFSWAYNGNITDSMKQRVKAAGGDVSGVLRFSLQWNENHDDRNDLDVHCVEPGGNHIYYPNQRRRHLSSGMLDVDIQYPERHQIAVENITWANINRMPVGVYKLFVRNYAHRGGRSGFSAEVEYDGQIFEYEYHKELRQKEDVMIAKVKLDENGFKIVESLPSTMSAKTVWGIKTNQFHPVSVLTFSPNYWDEQNGIGHKHFFFMLAGCTNDEQPNGFFNEYLRQEFMEHKRVFEALGSKMKIARSENQLSGLGFSSTRRVSLVCKVDDNRVVKIVF